MALKYLSGLNLTSELQANGSAGTYGQVLMSTGSGAAPTWTPSLATSSTYVTGGKLAADQAITVSGTDTNISFVSNFDPQSWWSASTKRFTPTIAGYYSITLNVLWTSSSNTGQTNAQIRKNGNSETIQQRTADANNPYFMSANKIIYLNGSTDYIEFTVWSPVTTQSISQGNSSGSGTSFSAALLASGNNVYDVAGKNALINGNFDFWQRYNGTASAVAGTATYWADRWFVLTSGTGANYGRDAIVIPASNATSYSAKVSAAAVGNTFTLNQVIESAIAWKYAGQSVTISAKVAADSSMPMTLSLGWSATSDQAATGSFTNIPPTSGGTATPTGTTFVNITGTFAVPSNAKSLKVTFGPTTNNTSGVYYYVSQVQLELGSVATTFSRAGGTIAGELAACQRFYWKLAGSGNSSALPVTNGAYYNAATCYAIIRLPVTMRGAPSLSSSTNTGFSVYALGAVKSTTSVSLGSATTDTAEFSFTTASIATAGAAAFIRFPANSVDYLEFNAEL